MAVSWLFHGCFTAVTRCALLKVRAAEPGPSNMTVTITNRCTAAVVGEVIKWPTSPTHHLLALNTVAEQQVQLCASRPGADDGHTVLLPAAQLSPPFRRAAREASDGSGSDLTLDVPQPRALTIMVVSGGGAGGEGGGADADIELRATCHEPHTQTVLLGAPLRSLAASRPRSTIALEINCAPPLSVVAESVPPRVIALGEATELRVIGGWPGAELAPRLDFEAAGRGASTGRPLV